MLAPLGPTLKKSLNFYIAYKKLEVNIGLYTKFQDSKFIDSKIKVGVGDFLNALYVYVHAVSTCSTC
jgi:hypothetical protein